MKRPRNRNLPLQFEPYAKVVWFNYPDNIEKPYALEYCGPMWTNALEDFFRNNKEISDLIWQLDTDMGMTAQAIEIHFKYDTPDDVIQDICTQAIQFVLKETQPKFNVGQTALFKTTQSDLVQYDNREVIVRRLLTDDECDIDEVGYMYEVAYYDAIFQAYQDELS